MKFYAKNWEVYQQNKDGLDMFICSTLSESDKQKITLPDVGERVIKDAQSMAATIAGALNYAIFGDYDGND